MKKVTVFDSCMEGSACMTETSQSVRLVFQLRNEFNTADIAKAIEEALNKCGFLDVARWDEDSNGKTVKVY